MRWALWLLVLFALASLLALFAGHNHGTVSIFWPPHRIDVSLNLAVLALAGFVLAVHLALRSWQTLFRLPERAQAWRSQQRERLVSKGITQAMAQMAAGRFVRARTTAQEALAAANGLMHDDPDHAKSAGVNHMRALAAWMASEAAHALQERGERDAYAAQALQFAAKDASVLQDGLQLRRARWALDDRDPAAALATLHALPQGVRRRTHAMRMQLRAARLTGKPQEALEVARLLGKHGAFTEDAHHKLVASLAAEVLQDQHDLEPLKKAWDKLDAREKSRPEVVAVAVERWMSLGGAALQARLWVEPLWARFATLDARQAERFAHAATLSMSGTDNTWLARAEQLLSAHGASPAAQSIVGLACADRQLWGKAKNLLQRATPALQHAPLKQRCEVALGTIVDMAQR